MAIIPGYGGVLSLGGSVHPARSIQVDYERASIDTTELADIREKRGPGRTRRYGSFVLMARDSTADDAIRSHMNPANLAAAKAASLALSYVDGGGLTTALTIHLTRASRIDGGSPTEPGTWSCEFEEQ